MCPFCHTCDSLPGVDCLMASYAIQCTLFVGMRLGSMSDANLDRKPYMNAHGSIRAKATRVILEQHKTFMAAAGHPCGCELPKSKSKSNRTKRPMRDDNHTSPAPPAAPRVSSSSATASTASIFSPNKKARLSVRPPGSATRATLDPSAVTASLTEFLSDAVTGQFAELDDQVLGPITDRLDDVETCQHESSIQVRAMGQLSLRQHEKIKGLEERVGHLERIVAEHQAKELQDNSEALDAWKMATDEKFTQMSNILQAASTSCGTREASTADRPTLDTTLASALLIFHPVGPGIRSCRSCWSCPGA